jgi:hypothetical protein
LTLKIIKKNLTFGFLEFMFNHFPNVTTLDISRCEPLVTLTYIPDDITTILMLAPNLKILIIKGFDINITKLKNNPLIDKVD